MRRLTMMLMVLGLLAGLTGFAAVGCEEKSPVEKAGEKLEEAGDEAEDAAEDAQEGIEDAAEDM